MSTHPGATTGHAAQGPLMRWADKPLALGAMTVLIHSLLVLACTPCPGPSRKSGWTPPRLARCFERKGTRDEATKAVADRKAEGMQINEVAPGAVAHMRDKPTRVNEAIAANVGMDRWQKTQAELGKLHGAKK